MLDPANLLADLIAIPSVNPMGRPPADEEPYESHVTDYLQRLFERCKLPWRRQNVHPGRDNILAVIERDPSAGLLLLEVHQDTVPVDGMTIEPFTPIIRDGRMYGRGACDVKGGMAAMLSAVMQLADERPPGMPSVVLACTVNEEHGFTGAAALAKTWRDDADSLFERRPDAAIVAEPTELSVVVAHKGTIRWRCRTRGRSVHSSDPSRGDNAIYRMAPVLSALERYQRDVAPTLRSHPLCGGPTLSVGTIHGGLSVNTVPDSCEIEIDRRLTPGENPAQARQAVIDFLASQPSIADVQHDPAYLRAAGLTDRLNGPLAERLIATAAVASQPIGVNYGTDAPAYEAAGVPTVVFGPGSIEQAHTADEWIELEQVRLAAEILYRFAAS